MQSPVPPSFIYWYKGKRVMNYSQRGGINVITERSTRTSKLLIAKATSADSGNYTCSPSSSGEFPHFPSGQPHTLPPPSTSCPASCASLLVLQRRAASSSSNANANDAAAADGDTNVLILLSEYVSVASLVLLPLAINVTFLANGNGNDCLPPPLPDIFIHLCASCAYLVCVLHSLSPPPSNARALSADSASVVVHVINGEHPAAMQHGNSSASSLRWSPVPLFASTTAAAFAVTWNWNLDWDWVWDWNWSSLCFVSSLPAALGNSWSRQRQRLSSSWS